MIRKPAVAGKFYPMSPDAINKQIKEFEVEVKQKIDCLGVVSPHAGYVFSGQVAARRGAVDVGFKSDPGAPAVVQPASESHIAQHVAALQVGGRGFGAPGVPPIQPRLGPPGIRIAGHVYVVVAVPGTLDLEH